jgi:hypothetical protein
VAAVAAYGGGVQGFFVGHCGHQYVSTALMDPMTKAFVADIHGFVASRGLELVGFAMGQRKDDLSQQFLAKFTDVERCCSLVGCRRRRGCGVPSGVTIR